MTSALTVAALALDDDRARWNQPSLSSGQLAKEYGFTDVDGSQPDIWRHIADSEGSQVTDISSYR